MINRFTVLDEFGGALRTFPTKEKAQQFMRNKRGCTLREITLIELLGGSVYYEH